MGARTAPTGAPKSPVGVGGVAKHVGIQCSSNGRRSRCSSNGRRSRCSSNGRSRSGSTGKIIAEGNISAVRFKLVIKFKKILQN